MDKCHDKYHFIALGGIGQSALAKILLEQGFRVSGSDIKNSATLDCLRLLGAEVFIGHSAKNIKEACKVIVSTAIKEDNPELIEAKRLGCEILHRSDLLKIISKNCKKFIGFSGTHGKTTTSGLLSYVLDCACDFPSFALGGIIPELQTNAKSSKDYMEHFFVAELDESDGTIVKYAPDIWVINNLEADHPEFYKNGLDELIETFVRGAKNVGAGAKILINADDDGCLKFQKAASTKAQIITFAIKNSACYQAKNIKYEKNFTTFDVFYKEKLLENIKIQILGEHNVYNALAVVATLNEAGCDISRYKKYFEKFNGMGRRFQHVAKFNDIEVIDDYAHHPTEIKCALKTLRNYTKNKIIAVFQPHRYTRFKGLFEEFKKSFDDCDEIYIVDVYSFGDKTIEEYKSERFAAEMKSKCTHLAGSIEDVARALYPKLSKGDVVISIGAGDITNLAKFLEIEYERTL